MDVDNNTKERVSIFFPDKPFKDLFAYNKLQRIVKHIPVARLATEQDRKLDDVRIEAGLTHKELDEIQTNIQGYPFDKLVKLACVLNKPLLEILTERELQTFQKKREDHLTIEWQRLKQTKKKRSIEGTGFIPIPNQPQATAGHGAVGEPRISANRDVILKSLFASRISRTPPSEVSRPPSNSPMTER